MNPEINVILQKIRKYEELDREAHISALMACLQVLLAEENEKSTKRIAFLTWVIVILTAVLVLTVFFEFPKVFVQVNQKPYLSIKKTDQHEKNDPSDNKTNLPLNGEIAPHMKIKK